MVGINVFTEFGLPMDDHGEYHQSPIYTKALGFEINKQIAVDEFPSFPRITADNAVFMFDNNHSESFADFKLQIYILFLKLQIFFR